MSGGCSERRENAEQEAAQPERVATIGESIIPASQFKEYLQEMIPASGIRPTKASVQKRLDEMILEEVLYQEGLRLGLNKRPELQRRIRHLLIQHLLEEEVAVKIWGREITEEELLEQYSLHEAAFNTPGLVRVADIFIRVPTAASPDEKARLHTKAKKILDMAKAGRDNRSGFARLINIYSDTPDTYSLGDTGFFDEEGNPGGIDPLFARAAFALERNGSIHEEPIETKDGYHVIMRIAKRSAVHTSFAKVRDRLEQQLRQEETQKLKKKYISQLKNRATIRREDEIIDGITKEILDEYKSLPQQNKRETPHSPIN